MCTTHHTSLVNINKIKPRSRVMLISSYFLMLLKSIAKSHVHNLHRGAGGYDSPQKTVIIKFKLIVFLFLIALGRVEAAFILLREEKQQKGIFCAQKETKEAESGLMRRRFEVTTDTPCHSNNNTACSMSRVVFKVYYSRVCSEGEKTLQLSSSKPSHQQLLS